MSKVNFVGVQSDDAMRPALRWFNKHVAELFEETEVEIIEASFKFKDGSYFSVRAGTGYFEPANKKRDS